MTLHVPITLSQLQQQQLSCCSSSFLLSSSLTLLLSLSLFCLIMMMTFCKKSVYSFLGLTTTFMDSTSTDKLSCKCQGVSPPLSDGGLGLITATAVGDIHRSHNVVESSTIKSSSPPSSPPQSTRKDPGGLCFNFFDDLGGAADGLMSCTESLGFESCDERRVDDEIELSPVGCSRRSTERMTQNWRKTGGRREVKTFPPPLSSFDRNGQPSFFLRSVRKNGRLELTEVRIDRPEILCAFREDGRLRLHLIRNDRFDASAEQEQYDDETEEIHEKQEQKDQEIKHEEEEEVGKESAEDCDEQEEEEEIKEEESSTSVREWRLPVTGEGLRRCHELVNHRHDYHHPHHHHSNHHHNFHVWSQPCVTSR